MPVRFKAEIRKVAGTRYMRFRLLDPVLLDSDEEVLIAGALRECGVESDDAVGLYRSTPNQIGGIDISVADVQRLTDALIRRGFVVT